MGSNGTGKSTLIESVAWALYGNKNKDIVRDGKDGIRNYNASPKEDCSVKVIFELGGVTYELERSLKGKNNTPGAYLKGDGTLIATSDGAVSEKVEQLIGMGNKEFFISIFSRQKDLSALSDLAPAKRKEHIVRLLDIDILQNVVKKVSEDINAEKKVKDTLEASLKLPDGRMKKDVISEQISIYTNDMKRIEEELAAAEALENASLGEKTALAEEVEKLSKTAEEFLIASNCVKSKENEISISEKYLKDAENDINSLTEKLTRLPELEKKYQEHEKLLLLKEELDERKQIFENRKDLALKLKTTTDTLSSKVAEEENAIASLEEFSGASAELEAKVDEIKLLSEEISELQSKKSITESKLKDLKSSLNDLEERIRGMEEMGPDSVCPECERTLGEHHKLLLEKLLSEKEACLENINKLNEEKTHFDEELNKAKAEKAEADKDKINLEARREHGIKIAASIGPIRKRIIELTKEKEEFEAELNSSDSVEFNAAEYSETLMKLKELKVLSSKYSELTGESKNMPNLMKRKEEILESIASKKQELLSLKDDLKNIDYDENQFLSVKTSLKSAEEKYESAKEVKNLQEKNSAVTNEKINSSLREAEIVKERENSVNICAEKICELEVLKEAFVGLKDNMMERIIPALSETASLMFNDMTNGRYTGMELDDDYNIIVNDENGSYPISRFSGGETDLANLCIRLAISRLLCERSSKDINLLVLDEIFGSQDQSRKRNIMEALSTLEYQFNQILLITHIDDIKDMMPNVIVISDLNDGESTAELLEL